MDDLELMDLFQQFVSDLPEPPPDEATGQAERTLRNRERLQEIAALRLTEPDVQHVLRDVCRESSVALGLPIGLITVVLDDAQYFAAQHGLDSWSSASRDTPMEWAFCRHTVADKAAFVVNDARTNARVQDSPLVTRDGLRCYAGMPLVTSRGLAVGSLCVAGVEPRDFTPAELGALQRHATEAMRRIETRRITAHV